MMPPLTPADEVLRLQALINTGLLDSPTEASFDRITRLAQQIFKVDIALVSLIDKDRQWFKSRQGLEVCETHRDWSFCGHAILDDKVFIVEDTHATACFADNPLVKAAPYIRFYAGAPLLIEGYRLGTLCVIDSQPRSFSEQDSQLLRLLADEVQEQISQRKLLQLSQTLAAKEAQAQLIIANANVGTWLWQPSSHTCQVNERWAQIIGYTLAELEPVTSETWQSRVHPEDEPKLTALVERYLSGVTEKYECKYRMRHKLGHWVWVHSHGQLLDPEVAQSELTLYGSLVDITPEREAQAQLERKNQALSLLNRISFELSGSLDEKVNQALILGGDFLRLSVGMVSEMVSDIYVVRWLAAPAPTHLEVGQHFAIEQTYCKLLLQQTGVLAIANMGQSAFKNEGCYQQLGFESYIAIRLEVDGQFFGTLNFCDASVRAEPFDETDQMFLKLFAHWLGEILSRQLHEERLTKLLDQMPGMLYQYRHWPDGHNSFPYSSNGIKHIYGVTPAQVQRDATQIFARIYEPDLAQVQSSALISQQTLSLWHAQYRTLQADGSLRWVEGRAKPERLDDGSVIWHGYMVDIQAEKQAELALTASEQRLRSLFELSSIGIALNDFKTGQFIDVNQALLDATGFSKSQLLKLHYRQLTPSQYHEQDRQAFVQLSTNGRFAPYEKEYYRWDGSLFPVRQQGVLITEANGRVLLWSLVEDISELKKVEQLQKEFVATVSHELRTPLTSITGSLALLSQGVLGVLPEKVQQLLKVAHHNSQRLNLLINDLLDIEKLAAGKVTFNPQSYDLTELVQIAMTMNQPLGEARGIKLVLKSELSHAKVVIDKDRFLQALSNLQSNAIKFSPSESEVRVSIAPSGEHFYRVSVADEGEGVPLNFRDRIFEKFAQADSSDSRQKGGTGLGLAITKQLMEDMQGRVGFDSQPQQGACFWLEVPREFAFCALHPAPN
ncbi:PAS domain S-box protein [Oceanisphaera avium]|uniref:histidine kinase n=1 Tax=Oceanisphaera avium TaxID=1903694 RepID=A0A1Y0CYQ4_9GAMM|nr:PAS domain S-box protein [Oceanisphaera avium]ART80419.1 two-component hybrid sensor and regulator [Oceanisphaera avium]